MDENTLLRKNTPLACCHSSLFLVAAVQQSSGRVFNTHACTVQASILSSFDFVVDVFTLPMGALETSAAALPGLVNAPYGSARLERAEIAVAFAANMLSGCTRRSSERCGDLQHLLEKRVPDDQYALDDQRG